MLLKLRSAFVLAFVLFFCAGCSKGIEVEETARINFRVAAVTAEPMSFQFSLNGNIDRLLTPSISNLIVPVTVPYRDSITIPVKIEQLPLQRAVANINFKPEAGKKVTHLLTVFQAKAGDVPFLVLPDSVSLPGLGYTKLQFTYSDEAWPERIKVRLYASASSAVSDSCMIHRYQFSNWASVVYKRLVDVYYDVTDVSTDEILVSRRFAPLTFNSMSEDYNIYQLAKSGTTVSFTALY